MAVHLGMRVAGVKGVHQVIQVTLQDQENSVDQVITGVSVN